MHNVYFENYLRTLFFGETLEFRTTIKSLARLHNEDKAEKF